MDDLGHSKRPDREEDLSDWQKEGIRRDYRYARDQRDRLWIMERYHFRDIDQVYNTANREKATINKQEDIVGPNSTIYDDAKDPDRLLLREDPETTEFNDQVDRYIAGVPDENGVRSSTDGRFGKIPIEGIAFFCRHTETAIMVRARHLGKRKFCKFWEAKKVTSWLGVDEEWLENNGIEVHDCVDTEGRIQMRLVRSSALMRITRDKEIRKELENRGADKFFLLEMDELFDALQKEDPDDPVWEASRWVSHGHICINPRAGASFRLFDDGLNDPEMPGRELRLDDICIDPDDEEELFI